MFTGIVTAIGRIRHLRRDQEGLRVAIGAHSGQFSLEECGEGDSAAVSGVCLTMLEISASGFVSDVSAETLGATTLGEKVDGDRVNLELALRAGDRLGGHLVSGHVDAAINLLSRQPDGDAERMEFELPSDLAPYVSKKGSVCIDGVSLTVNTVQEDRFSVCIIPHTLETTTLGGVVVGQRVNLEVDMIARYLERLIQEKQS